MPSAEARGLPSGSASWIRSAAWAAAVAPALDPLADEDAAELLGRLLEPERLAAGPDAGAGSCGCARTAFGPRDGGDAVVVTRADQDFQLTG